MLLRCPGYIYSLMGSLSVVGKHRYAYLLLLAVAVLFLDGSPAAQQAGARTLEPPPKVVPARWHLMRPPAGRTIKIASTIAYCGGKPKPRIAHIRVHESRQAVTLTVFRSKPSTQSSNGGCVGLELGLTKTVTLSSRLRGRAIYDGSVSPPLKRWPR